MRLHTLLPSTAFALVAVTSCGGGAPAPSAPVAAKAPEPSAAKDVEVSLNSRGLREDREIEYAKPKGRKRVVCVGGAVTFGEGVAHDATYAAWMQKNMRGRAYDVEVLNAGKPGFGAAEAAAQLEGELLKYGPDLVVVSIQKGEGTTTAADLRRIEAMLAAREIVFILLAVPEFAGVEGYAPKAPAVYVVPSRAALDVFGKTNALVDTQGRWTEFSHMKMGNALAELIVGAPLICCATGPVAPNP